MDGRGLKTIASVVNFKVALAALPRRRRQRFTGCWVSKVEVQGVTHPLCNACFDHYRK